ncbi:uncharacterized protein [Elaeis guineensis]|uniref:Uncharacterized protein LOC105040619 isoform X1 n=2 Tax=Elaeis guineensis var. tenera TaxID=51953 RepID=A0A6I9QZE2_ELAGV|nr:uncharacterized protein LOC105040619 isoform X1 [Elaeis guineensis]
MACPLSSLAVYGGSYCGGSPRIKFRSGGHASSLLGPSSGLFGAPLSSSNFPGLDSSRSELNFRFHIMSTSRGSVKASKDISKLKNGPDHLLVLVHGILASPNDWIYAEDELKKRLGSNFLIYASSSNAYTKTLRGVDGAGRRLADEVLNVVQKTESLKKISFLAHSLGGLFTRYAITILYNQDILNRSRHENVISSSIITSEKSACFSNLGKIAGLEPINFITLATPHLGVRGKKQLPFLLGVPILEKLAPPLAPIFIGRTGRQLFLTDGKPSKPPLLLRMTSDYEDNKFISALASFKSRTLYANVSFDHMVGWRTSSIRRESELVEPSRRSLDGYKHVVDVEYCPPVPSEGPHFPAKAARAKEAAQTASNTQHTAEYYDMMEEEMIRGLQRVGWKKVDVSFHSAFWPFFAHNNIHVKSEWLHSAGAGVIAHVADNLKRQESHTFLAANL